MSMKEQRLKEGLTQLKLAEKSGLSLTAIQRIESSPGRGRAVTLKKIAQVLHCSIEDLL